MTEPTTKQRIQKALTQATVIAFDGCHKIYIAMDKEQADLFRSYGYGSDDPSFLQEVEQTDAGRAHAAEVLEEWWDDSCFLRFINTVRTTPNPNDGFDDIIAQGAEWRY